MDDEKEIEELMALIEKKERWEKDGDVFTDEEESRMYLLFWNHASEIRLLWTHHKPPAFNSTLADTARDITHEWIKMVAGSRRPLFRELRELQYMIAKALKGSAT